MPIFALLILVITLSLIYTYTNGFQDGSSVTASAIGSRSMTPAQAIVLVACAEFLGALCGGSFVANTIQSITDIPATMHLLPMLISGLLAAIIWNFITKSLHMPSSSTHALIGGILGGVIAGGKGIKYIVCGTIFPLTKTTGVCKIALSLFISPALGFIAGYFILLLALFLLSKATTKINRAIKSLQWFTVSMLAFSHGANDTQKAMGVIVLAMSAAHLNVHQTIPLWVRIATGTAMAFGIASLAPGIVKSVGSGIYRLRPIHSLSAQLASALILWTASATGGPVSATQVVSSSVMGIGAAERFRGVHWLIVKDMLVAWFLTIPAAGLLAWIFYKFVGHCLN